LSASTTACGRRTGRARGGTPRRPPPSSTARAPRAPPSPPRPATTRGEKTKGRKRHLRVDTAGRLLTVLVHAATVPEAVGAEAVLARARDLFPTIRKVWADSAYHTERLTIWLAEHWPALDLEIVSRPEGTKGVVVQPRRWVVERTVAWLTANRLLSKEYERLPWHVESWIMLASISPLLNRSSYVHHFLDRL